MGHSFEISPSSRLITIVTAALTFTISTLFISKSQAVLVGETAPRQLYHHISARDDSLFRIDSALHSIIRIRNGQFLNILLI